MLTDDLIRLREVSLLASVDFGRLWETMGGSVVCWRARLEGRTLAVLVGVEFGRGMLRRFQAMPDGCYMKIIFFDDTVNCDEITEGMLAAIGRFGYAKVFLNDYHAQLGSTGDFFKSEYHTTLVDISHPEWEPPDKKLRSEIRKAAREGVCVQPFDVEHLDSFLTLVAQSEERHGRKPKYSESFYCALATLAVDDDRIQWLSVVHQDKLAASHIYFVEDNLLLNWQVYFDPAFSFLKPNQFITATIATRMADLGVTTLNLGASPDSAGGLRFYKQKWGGTEYRYNCLQKQSWLGKMLR